MKAKIAIITQRYGQKVNGGAEQLARMLAERLVLVHGFTVEVLTTRAADYTTWENHYPEGVSDLNGVKIHRFTVDKKRDFDEFSKMTSDLYFNGKKFPGGDKAWIDRQGPYCPKCIDYIKKHRADYDVFIFFTYLYYLTVRGMGTVKEKAIFVPTAHDEPPIYQKLFKRVFEAPQAYIFNTIQEREFVCSLFDIGNKLQDVIGIGVDIPNNTDSSRFIKKYKADNYLLYAGRIDDGKNCRELFDYFIKYKMRNPSALKLVLIGKAVIEIPEHEDILPLGFVSDEDKADGMAGARMLVLPSLTESLSIVVLESMAQGTPVVVNGNCDVLREHCLRSNAGLFYKNYFEFEGCINYLLSHPDVYNTMKQNAQDYVAENYRWDVVINKYAAMIDKVRQNH